MTDIQNSLIVLNSKYATQLNGTKLSNVIFPFSGILKKDEKIIRSSISITNAQIPVSYYLINENNNLFRFSEDYDQYFFYIDYGNYQATSIIKIFNTKFTNLGLLITMSLNKLSGKFAFSTVTPLALFSDSTIKFILGFDDAFIITVPGGGVFVTAELPYPCNFLGFKLINIVSSKLPVNCFSSEIGGGTNILCTIANDQGAFNLISYTNQSYQSFKLNIEYIDSIDIQIVDENNIFIDFNNTPWTITLNLMIERQREIIEQPLPLNKYIENIQPIENIENIENIEPINSINDPINEPIKELENLKHPTVGYTFDSKQEIKKFGNMKVISMIVKRAPIQEAIYSALKIVSLGKVDKKNPYDSLFHLYSDLTMENGEIVRIEKNATILISQNKPDKQDTETMNVSMNDPIIFNTLLERTKQGMGIRYFPYNAVSNNCQDFINSVLNYNMLNTIEIQKFVKQDINSIFRKIPKYNAVLTGIITNIGGTIDNTKSKIQKEIKNINKGLDFLKN